MLFYWYIHWNMRAYVLFTLYVFAYYSGVQHILCYVLALFVFVLCVLCYRFHWIVHFWLHLRYSAMFIELCLHQKMYPSGVPDFVPCYLWGSSCSIFSLGFCVVICRSLFIFLFFFILTSLLPFLLPLRLLIIPLISLMNRVCLTVFHERRYEIPVTNWGIDVYAVSCSLDKIWIVRHIEQSNGFTSWNLLFGYPSLL